MRVEAGDFLRHLAKVRANDILMPFLQFMTSQFDSSPPHSLVSCSYNNVDPSQRDYMAKEWQLYALEVLSPNMLSKDAIRMAAVAVPSCNHPQEKVLVDYVYPEFNSPCGFLRARACRLYAAFKKLPLSEDHLVGVDVPSHRRRP